MWRLVIPLCISICTLSAQEMVAVLPVSLRTSPEIDQRFASTLVPFELDRGMILVSAESDGQEGTYVLDTGAPGLVFNESITIEEDQLTATGLNGAVAVQEGEVVQFNWSGVHQGATQSIKTDLSHLERALRQSLSGLIGYAVFTEKTLLVDYRKHHLLITNSDATQLVDPRFQVVDRLPMEVVEHLPLVKIEKAGKTYTFILDTGSGANVISAQAAKNFDLGRKVHRAELQGMDQKISTNMVVVVNDLPLGDERSKSQRFHIQDMAYVEEILGTTVDGILGYPLLKEYLFAINYEQGSVVLW